MTAHTAALDVPQTQHAEAPITMTYSVDSTLLYDTMIQTGRAMMRRREPTDGNRSGWRAIGIWLGIMVAVAAVIDLVAAASLSIEILYIIGGVIFGFVFYSVFLTRSYRRLARMMEANPVYQGPLTVTLTPEGAEVQTRASLHRFDWSVVWGVLQYDHGISLMIPTEMLPIPDSALPPDLSRAELVARIEGWREAGDATP